MAANNDIELQRRSYGRAGGGDRLLATEGDSDEYEASGYSDTSTKIWKLYGRESEKYDKALVDNWKGNTDSMLIFTGLFSTIVASFLIETYSSLIPASGSATPSAVRVNILMVLSLFFSVTSALVSTLIQQWAREYLQYSQPSAAPHKRGRVRAYLHDGLIRFQMRRLTYGVPVLLHLSVFLFFYALSEWLYDVNVPVGATARYCLVTLLAVYMVLSVLPLVMRNSPYQTALTTPLQACVSIIQASYIGLRQLVRRSSRVIDSQKIPGLFKSVHVDRARSLMKEIKKRASELDRSAMHWLLQELDEDDMDTFLSGLPGYIHSPLTNKKLAVEGLLEDGVPGRIREHITTCFRSVELPQEESMSRAWLCISSLRLISETASFAAVSRPGLENDDLRAIMEYLEPLCYNSSTALRASCIRGLVIREFLIPVADLDVEEISMKKFPDYLMPLYRVIRIWKTTENTQWSHLTGILTATDHPLPSDQEMWAEVVYDGPLINLAVLSYAVLSRADETDVNFDMALKTIETLLKSFGLAQVRASALARARFGEVLLKARAGNSGYGGGRAQITSLVKTLDAVISGLRLAETFAHTPKPMLPPRQIEAIFGPDQLRDRELLEAFAAHLPGFVNASTPEVSKSFMERLIMEDKLWEQLRDIISQCLDPDVILLDKSRMIKAFFDILEVAFEVLQESSVIDWGSSYLRYFSTQLWEVQKSASMDDFNAKVVHFRTDLFDYQVYHCLLGQFSLQRSRGEPLTAISVLSLKVLIFGLGVGTKEDYDDLERGPSSNSRNMFDLLFRAEEVLDVALRDGPLLHFCALGRWIYEDMASKASDLTTDDTKKQLNLLERMLNIPQLPLVNASEEIWVRFDLLRDSVRASVHDRVLAGDSSQTVERMRPLLDTIEKVDRMRPPADKNKLKHDDGSVSQDAWRPDGTPTSGSSMKVQVSLPAVGLGGPRDQSLSHPVHGTRPTTRTDTSTPFDWTPPGQSNLGVVNEASTSSIPTTQPGFGAEISFPQASAYSPNVPAQIHPQNVAALHAPQLSPGSSTFSHVADTENPTNLRAQARTTQSAPADNSVLLVQWRVLSNAHTSPPPSSGLVDELPPGDAEHHDPIHGDESGGLTVEFNAGDAPSGD